MNRGIVYFIQPTELIGTNRYKIGYSSKSSLDRIKDYHAGTRCIIILESINPYNLEKIIKQHFKAKYTLIAGTEYFEGNQYEMHRDFLTKFHEFQLAASTDSMEIDEDFQEEEEESNARKKLADTEEAVLRARRRLRKNKTTKKVLFLFF
jgi:hypothetical protein